MFIYQAYGLVIRSPIEIPEFIETNTNSYDVTFAIKGKNAVDNYLTAEEFASSYVIKVNKTTSLYYVKYIGLFIIENGNQVIIIPTHESSEDLIPMYLVGNIMGIVLYQRGFLALHASAVNINGEAVAFLGKSGEGKSSTAATFHRHGYNFLTDDVAPINLAQKPITLTPAFPQMKLSPETADYLGYDFESLLLLHSSEKKRGYRLSEEFSSKPLPIQCIYVLTEDANLSIEPMKAAEAGMELLRHSRPTTLNCFGGESHFLQCMTLAKENLVYRLRRPRNFKILPKVVELVEQHVSSNFCC